MLLCGAAAAAAFRPRPAAALQQLRVSGLNTEAMTPLYYAIKTGRFARAGLDVSYTPMNSGSAAISAVIAGDLEIATSNLLSLTAAHVHGLPIAIVGPQVMYTPQSNEALLQVAPDAAYRTGADLKGKTIAVPTLDGINVLAAKAWVDKHGGESSTLKFVEIPIAAEPDAVAHHRADAVLLTPPVLEASLAEGTSKTIGDPMGAIASLYVISAFVAKSDWATQNADSVRRFWSVLRDSAMYVNTHHAETASYVSAVTGIDPAVIAKMARTTSGTSLDPRQFQPLIDAAAKYGFISHAFPASEFFWSGAESSGA